MKNATYLKLLPTHITTRTSLTAIMKYLVLALLLCALLSLSNAVCYVTPLKLGVIHTHCQDVVDGTWHALGSKWRNSDCMDCTCLKCCPAYSTPRNFSADCMSVFDSEACEYVVHKKDDPTVLCPVFDPVMKESEFFFG